MKIRSIFMKILLSMIFIVMLSSIAILGITGRLFDNAYETQIKNENKNSSSFVARSVENFMG